MFCEITIYLKIEKIHYETLTIFHQSNASYSDLLECNGKTSIHQWHLRFLSTEIYKRTVTINPRLMWTFFRENKVPYNLRKGVQSFSFLQQGRQPM